MTSFRARFYDGVRALAHEATLIGDAGQRVVIVEVADQERRVIPWTEMRIEPPLGRTARKIWLDAVAHAEVEDSPEFREWEKTVAPRGRMHFVSALEAHRGAIAASVLGLTLLVIAFLKIGVPVMARSVAFKLPQETLNALGDQTLKTLDHGLVRPRSCPGNGSAKFAPSFAGSRRGWRGCRPTASSFVSSACRTPSRCRPGRSS